jgi:lysophospholipase L1-like esterase
MTTARKILGLAVLGTCLQGKAQKIDSNYHNYLYDSRVVYFKQLPAVKDAIVFFGDSITQWGDWGEFTGFKKVLNRGIAGDNSFGLRARIDEVTRHFPSKLFILIGTNDLNIKNPAATVVDNYRKIICLVKAATPNTKIFIQSVLPINNDLIGRQYYSSTNEEISKLNTSLKKLAESEGVTYIDIYPLLLDKHAQLDAKYTYDGLHLSGMGYLKWVDYLKGRKYL